MSTSRYDWHRDILGLPSTVGGLLFGMALHSWWLGIGLSLVALVVFYQPYRLYFSSAEGHPRRRHVGSNLVFIVAQLIFWVIAFGLLHVTTSISAI